MMKVFSSVAMIVITLGALGTATYAYFADGKVLGSNTFSTGNVYIDGFNVQSLSVTNLAPGVPQKISNVGINYVGTLNADLYIGARGSSTPDMPSYIADKLSLKIFRTGTTDLVWEGYVNTLSTAWQKLETNTGAGWKAYDLEFTLDSDVGNNYQNRLNTDTEIMVYAVTTGGTTPKTVPYLTTGNFSAWSL